MPKVQHKSPCREHRLFGSLFRETELFGAASLSRLASVLLFPMVVDYRSSQLYLASIFYFRLGSCFYLVDSIHPPNKLLETTPVGAVRYSLRVSGFP
jgi:hypothetical protein